MLKYKNELERNVLLKIFIDTPLNFKFVSVEELQENTNFILNVVEKNGLALEHLNHEFQNKNRNIVFAAITQNGRAFDYASPELKRDRNIVSAAIDKIPILIINTSHDFQNNNSDIVLNAVTQNGDA